MRFEFDIIITNRKARLLLSIQLLQTIQKFSFNFVLNTPSVSKEYLPYSELLIVSVIIRQLGNWLIKEGDLIGLEGNTGWTGKENRHLHMSVHYDWKKQSVEYWSKLGWLPRSIPFEFKVETVRSSVVSIQSTKTIKCIRRKFNRFLDAALRGI